MTDTGRRARTPGPEIVDFLAVAATASAMADRAPTHCEREPIHIPGAIQPHGVLLAVREADLVVRLVSANCRQHLGVSPSVLIGAPLADALGAEPAARLRAALEDPRARGDDPLAFAAPGGAAYEATWHRSGEAVIVELEPADEAAFVAVSTLFQDVRSAIDALQAPEGVQALCDAAASEIKQLTGYDRVLVYRFHADDHGDVVAEARAPGLEPYLGLHYPASDIPRQARELYRVKNLGVIADVDYEPVPLLAGDDDDGRALNLTFAGLRSVSPSHLEYLRAMGVQATLTISLKRGPDLWGLITCHHRESRRIDGQLRAACRLLAQLFSLQLEVVEGHERRAYGRRLAAIGMEIGARVAAAETLADGLADSRASLLELVSADGVVVHLDGSTVIAGAVPPEPAVDSVLARLRSQRDPSVLVSSELAGRFAELEPFAERAAGALAVQLSADPADVAVWFRGELVHTVFWGGDPDQGLAAADAGRSGEAGDPALGPRRSFEAWAQEVRGQSRPWLEAEVEVARGLAAAVPDLLLARARDRLAHQAMHDALTGLPNRALRLDRLEAALRGPERRGDGVGLLFVDVDRFKLVNDRLGHAAGDALLCGAADRLGKLTRDGDLVARFGGDEFVVLCDDIPPAEAEVLGRRIVEAFRFPFVLGDDEFLATASVGVAIPGAGATPDQLLREADTAMYRAKQGGRDSATTFRLEMRDPAAASPAARIP